MNSPSKCPIPLVTLTLCGLAVAASCSTGLTELLEYRRAAVLDGAYWLLLSGHLTHWSLDHLLWDALVVLICGCAVELNYFRVERRTGPLLLAAAILASSVGIGTALVFFEPALACYRGLSGLSVALYMLAALDCLKSSNDRVSRAIGILAVAGLALKVCCEGFTGAAIFVDHSSAGFTTVYSAHLAGAFTAAAVHLLYHRNGRGYDPFVKTGRSAWTFLPKGTAASSSFPSFTSRASIEPTVR